MGAVCLLVVDLEILHHLSLREVRVGSDKERSEI